MSVLANEGDEVRIRFQAKATERADGQWDLRVVITVGDLEPDAETYGPFATRAVALESAKDLRASIDASLRARLGEGGQWFDNKRGGRA